MVADGRLAVDAAIDSPTNVAIDRAGTLYLTSASENTVYKIGGDGILRRIAGTGVPGFSGDGGPATAARLELPWGIAVDSKGNVYVADSINRRVRRITPNGMIDTVAGNGEYGFGGDGGPARKSQINTNNHRVRKWTPTGILTTIAGNGTLGFSGDGGPAISAQLNFPLGVTADSAGNIYIADTLNLRIRKCGLDGTIRTIAGVGRGTLPEVGFGGDGGAATSARLSVTSVVVDSAGNLYFGDQANRRIRKITVSGIISTIAGIGPPATP